MAWVIYIGYAAAVLTTIAFIPQVTKTWRSRKTGDISLHMFLILSAGLSLWLVYGILLKNWPIMMANGITLFLASVVLGFKMRYG